MPSTIAQPASSKDSKSNVSNKPSTSKSKRVVRRRGRARGEMSDDELEREALTDSGESHLSSESGDEDEEDDKDQPAAKSTATNGAPRAASSTRSAVPPSAAAAVPAKAVPNGVHGTLLAESTNWSDMVTSEEAEGGAALPVVDFANLDQLAADHSSVAKPSTSNPTVTATTATNGALTPAQIKAEKLKAKRKAKKEKLKAEAAAAKAQAASQPAASTSTAKPTAPASASSSKAPPPAPAPTADAEPTAEPTATSPPPAESTAAESSSARPPPRMNPRQAYLDRLNNDPSYVPRVGSFWGHDDRLMDKELRSMSPWWRGRGRGGPRGSGRGEFRGGRGGFGGGRGRGGAAFVESAPKHADASSSSVVDAAAESSSAPAASSVPAINGDDSESWSRSGPLRGHWSEARGRGGRGRGGFSGRGAARAGAPTNGAPRESTQSPAPAAAEGSTSPAPAPKPSKKPAARPLKKPERPWTKPLDTSLVAGSPRSPSFNNRKAASPAPSDVRVKLPGGSPSTSVAIPPDVANQNRALSRASDQRSEVGSAVSEVSSRPAIVKLPSSSRTKAVEAAVLKGSAGIEHTSSPLANVVSAPPADENALQQPVPTTQNELDPFVVRVPPEEGRVDIIRQSLGSAPTSSAASEHIPTSSTPLAPLSRPESTAPPPPFYPAALPPATFGRLPPGVAYGENGMLYEIATGRPVILAAPPPPHQPIFHPPPPHHHRMPSNPYAMPFPPPPRTYSQTPPLIVASGTPPPQNLYPTPTSNGYPGSPAYSPYPLETPTMPMDANAPIFVPARSSAVEIRAPSVDSNSESAGGKSSTGTAVSSISTSSSAPTVLSSTNGKSITAPKSTKQPSNLRTSVSAPALEVQIPKDNDFTMHQQQPHQAPPYPMDPSGGGYYYPGPGPEYAVYAPVPLGPDGQPVPVYGVEYGGGYYPGPEQAYAMSPYPGEQGPYVNGGGYGTVYYGHQPGYGPPTGGEGENGWY